MLVLERKCETILQVRNAASIFSVYTVWENKTEGKKTKLIPRLEADTNSCHCLVLHFYPMSWWAQKCPCWGRIMSIILPWVHSILLLLAFMTSFLSCIYFSMPCIILIELACLVCIFRANCLITYLRHTSGIGNKGTFKWCLRRKRRALENGCA